MLGWRVLARPAAAYWVAALVLVSCGSESVIFVQGEVPSGANTVLFALEQEDLLHVEAFPTTQTAFDVTPPGSLSTTSPASLTMLSLAQSLGGIGLRAPGPLLPATGRSRPLSSLEPLRVDHALLFDDASSPTLVQGDLSAELSDFPIARVASCPGFEHEFVEADGPIRDLVSVRADLAVGLSSGRITTFRSGGLEVALTFPAGEIGHGIGKSRNGLIWVSTSSRAAVFDPETNSLVRTVPIASDQRFSGVFDDEADGRLYLLSTEAELWTYEHSSGALSLRYSFPEILVRRPEVSTSPPRFVPLPEPGGFVLALEEVAAVLEHRAEGQRLFTGERPGAGYSAISTLPTGEILVAESFGGDLYLYGANGWKSAGQGPTRVYGLSYLEARRWLFVTVRAVIGVLDLDNPRSCPERAILNWNNAKNLVHVSGEYWMGVTSSQFGTGWGRVRLIPAPL